MLAWTRANQAILYHVVRLELRLIVTIDNLVEYHVQRFDDATEVGSLLRINLANIILMIILKEGKNQKTKISSRQICFVISYSSGEVKIM